MTRSGGNAARSDSKVAGGLIERVDPLAPRDPEGGAIANDDETAGRGHVDDLAVISLREEVRCVENELRVLLDKGTTGVSA